MSKRSKPRRRSSPQTTSHSAAVPADASNDAGELDTGFQLWRNAMRWQRAVNGALRPLKLTHTQFLTLLSLDRAERAAGDAVSQRAVMKEAGLDEATTSAVLRALDTRGLIDRGPTFDDARTWRVIVSSKGRQTLRSAQPLVVAASQRFFKEAPPARY